MLLNLVYVAPAKTRILFYEKHPICTQIDLLVFKPDINATHNHRRLLFGLELFIL